MRRSFVERGPHDLVDEALPPSDLDALLAESDYVLLSAPATAETAQLIDAPFPLVPVIRDLADLPFQLLDLAVGLFFDLLHLLNELILFRCDLKDLVV